MSEIRSMTIRSTLTYEVSEVDSHFKHRAKLSQVREILFLLYLFIQQQSLLVVDPGFLAGNPCVRYLLLVNIDIFVSDLTVGIVGPKVTHH